MKMKIEAGEYFVVHYNFPSGKSWFSAEEVKLGVTMPIPKTECFLKLPPTPAKGKIAISYKVCAASNG